MAKNDQKRAKNGYFCVKIINVYINWTLGHLFLLLM